MARLERRSWVPGHVEDLVASVADPVEQMAAVDLAAEIERLAERSRTVHEIECVNLNPATNTMNPRAEALLASGLGSRPSLGYPGAKYEMGLEAIERIEILAAELAAEVFGAPFTEVRVGSGALANLYTFMATCSPGDAIIAPPPTIGGHVTHHDAGAAGRYGLITYPAPIDAARYSVDVAGVAALADEVRPKLITIGGSLNLAHHPVAALREVADDVGATLLFDAAHLSGPIAGGAWPNPLGDGAHVMTMSTYKSLAGPPCGLLVTTDESIAERIDAIAYPGLSANFDVANTAALAMTLLDWRVHGAAYARAMVDTARALAAALADRGVPVHGREPFTASHAFALDAGPDGGHGAAMRLRRANLLTCAIGLPHGAGDGLRVGTNEMVRWGLNGDHVDELAALVAGAWQAHDPAEVADHVTAFRRRFTRLHFTT